MCEYARAVLCNSSGQYEQALVAARSASESQEVVAENWGLSELIEAATRTGRTGLAAEALKRLARKARATGTDWALGVEARARALLSDDERAESHFIEAIDHLRLTRVRGEPLRHVYAKLGIQSRRELTSVLARSLSGNTAARQSGEASPAGRGSLALRGAGPDPRARHPRADWGLYGGDQRGGMSP